MVIKNYSPYSNKCINKNNNYDAIHFRCAAIHFCQCINKILQI